MRTAGRELTAQQQLQRGGADKKTTKRSKHNTNNTYYCK